jgi:L-ascorbate metabolism protein UlaG (beta-lactamase superfamily)
MKKKLLLSLAVLFFIGFAFLFIKTRPSGDIQTYAQYYTHDASNPTNNQVKVTFFGVSTLLFDDGETQLLIDGFFTRASLLAVYTTAIASDTALIDNLVSTYKMDRVKGIFATHSHFDHAFDVAYTAKKTNATLYGSTSTLNIGRGGDVKEDQLKLFQPYEKVNLGKFTIQVIPSKHSPNNALKDDGVVIEKPLRQPAKIKAYTEGGSYDFLIRHNDHKMYVKPSPNYVEGVLDTLKADVVFIGIATIGKQTADWQKAFYEQTIGKLKPKLLIPLHWDDFFKPISENLDMLPRFANDSPKDFDFMINKTKADNIDFKILQGTKSIVLFKN